MKKNIETQNVPAFSVKVGDIILFYGTPSAVLRVRRNKDKCVGLPCTELLIQKETDPTSENKFIYKPQYIYRFDGEALDIITQRN